MGVDLPEEADVPPEGHADRRDDQTGGGRTARPGGTQAETRSHEECYNDLRIADAKQQSVAAQRITAEEQAAADTWNEKVTESRWIWAEYQRKWPPEERGPVDTSNDPPGSWRGDGDRFLKVADNGRVEATCDLIADREREKISPALRAIESQDPDRHLIGFDDCLKGRDRIKEKVHDAISLLRRSPEEAVSRVPDAIRYTFQYQAAHYTQGVWMDIERLKGQGFELQRLGTKRVRLHSAERWLEGCVRPYQRGRTRRHGLARRGPEGQLRGDHRARQAGRFESPVGLIPFGQNFVMERPASMTPGVSFW